ncbi:MAG: hypothetical protein ACKN9K_01185, partial [Dolichospermum sp.]
GFRSYEVHIKPPLEERGGGWGWGDFVPHNIGKCCKILQEHSLIQEIMIFLSSLNVSSVAIN